MVRSHYRYRVSGLDGTARARNPLNRFHPTHQLTIGLRWSLIWERGRVLKRFRGNPRGKPLAYFTRAAL
jgi:hypothetical protein